MRTKPKMFKLQVLLESNLAQIKTLFVKTERKSFPNVCSFIWW